MFESCNIPPDPGQQQPATKAPDYGRPGRRGVKERQRSQYNIPEGKALGDGRAGSGPSRRGPVSLYICDFVITCAVIHFHTALGAGL